MPTQDSRPRQNIEFYRKQAKALLKSARSGEADALARLRRHVPRLAEGNPAASDLALHDAQLAIARENGHASWPRFHEAIAAIESLSPKHFRPHVRGIKWYEERIAGVVGVHAQGLDEAIAAARRHLPRFAGADDATIRAATLSEDDARLIIARDHGFADWSAFKNHIVSIESGETTEPFTLAFEAIEHGDETTFAKLVRAHPDLIAAQGTNGSSLLNLAASLRRPAMCRQLLEAGADPDLPTTRGVTPLHAAACHDSAELVELLIEAGASPDASAFGDGGTPLAMALFWGNVRAADALARHRVVPENLRIAAGCGRLDLIDPCFENGELTAAAKAHRAFYRPHVGFPVWMPSDARQEILDEALTYAARNGKIEAIERLLHGGAKIDGDPYRGTALIWAVYKGRIEVVRWLLDHGADPSRRATFGGPRHGQGITALHAAAENGRDEIAELLVSRGADLTVRDEVYNAAPWGWAEHFGFAELSAKLKPPMPSQ